MVQVRVMAVPFDPLSLAQMNVGDIKPESFAPQY